MTTTAAANAVGDTNVKVASVTNLVAGQPFFIDTGQNLETGVIASVGTAGATGTGVTLTAPLKLAHASGVRFNVNQGQPIGFTGDTLEHLNFFAAGAPHGIDGETSPTEELLRALELPSQYTALLASSDDYLGATPAPTGTVAYFETDPVNPTATNTVTLRRELRSHLRRRHGRAPVLLGLRRRHERHRRDRHPHLRVGRSGPT